MTEAECNAVEQHNFQAWLERQEERWEKPIQHTPVRAIIPESELPF